MKRQSHTAHALYLTSGDKSSHKEQLDNKAPMDRHMARIVRRHILDATPTLHPKMDAHEPVPTIPNPLLNLCHYTSIYGGINTTVLKQFYTPSTDL